MLHFASLPESEKNPTTLKFMSLRTFPMRSGLRKVATVAITCLALSQGLLVGSSLAKAADEKSPRKILSGWLPSYSMKSALATVLDTRTSDMIREVSPFWYQVNSATLIKDNYAADNPFGNMESATADLHAAGFQILPTLTDGMPKLGLAGVLANPASRTQLVNSLLALATKKDSQNRDHFDGLDLDFEVFAFQDGRASWSKTTPNWIAFINELSQGLHSKNKLLSITTPVLFSPTSSRAKQSYDIYSWAQVAPAIDRLRIMTYDYSTDNAGPIGPITWAEESVKYAVSVMPASKVSMGVAGYGHGWVTKVTGTCPADAIKTVYVGARTSFRMVDAQKTIDSYKAIPVYNKSFEEVNFTYQKVYTGQTATGLATSCTAAVTAWYQNSQSFAARVALAGKYRLAGIAQWTFGMEDAATMPAVRAVALSIAPDKVKSEITIDKSNPLLGETILLNGSFTLPDKTPIAGLPIIVQGKSASDSDWRDLITLITAIDGRVSQPILAGKNISLRVKSPASWERSESISTSADIRIGSRLSVNAPAVVARNRSWNIQGIIQPHRAGVVLVLQIQSNGKWIDHTTTLSRDDGSYTFALTSTALGIAQYRVRASADSVASEASSSVFSIITR